ncbi:hypothetical protein BKA80DRAFT_271553 [Phyllosticta citrichinensis]
MSEEDDDDDDGQTERAAGHGDKTIAAASPSTDLPMSTPPAAAAAKFAPASAPRQAFTSPALVIGARRQSGEATKSTAPSHNTTAPAPATGAADATAGIGLGLDHRRSANASPAPTRLGPVHYSSPLSDDDNDIYHDASSQRVASALSTFSATPADGEEHEHAGNDEGEAEDEDMDGLDERGDIEALDAGETPLTDDPPSRSLELQRTGDGSAAGKTQRAKEKEKDGDDRWSSGRKTQPRARQDKERDVWRDVVGAGVERDSKRRRREVV